MGSALLLLLLLSVSAVLAQLSADKKQELLDSHNYFRRGANPTAANMAMMSWSDELAAVAQAYSQGCHNVASPNATSGENRAYAPYTATQNYTTLVGSQWVTAGTGYSYDTNTCSALSSCSGYLQVVWATSDRVGCGATVCNNFFLSSGLLLHTVYFLVCNYATAATNLKPYEKGSSCSQCPGDKPACLYGLCAPINTAGLQVTTSGDPVEGHTYTATCNVSATAGVGATFNLTLALVWTSSGSEVVNTSNVTAVKQASGDSYALIVTFAPLLASHAGQYRCTAKFLYAGPSSFDSSVDFNITVLTQDLSPNPTSGSAILTASSVAISTPSATSSTITITTAAATTSVASSLLPTAPSSPSPLPTTPSPFSPHSLASMASQAPLLAGWVMCGGHFLWLWLAG